MKDDGAPWVRMETTGDFVEVVCDRCHAAASASLPMVMDTFLGMMTGFLDQHRECPAVRDA